MLLLSSLLFAAGLGTAPELPPVTPGTLRAVLVRHGQAFTNLDPEPDLPKDQLDRLTRLGHTQAGTAAEALRALGARFVLASPAGRTRETAADIRQALRLEGPITVEPRLRPLELGVDDKGEELDFKERWAAWQDGRDPVPPKGESLEQVAERVLQLLREERVAFGSGTVVLVAHSEVISSVIGKLRGVPPPQRLAERVPNGSLTVVDVGPDGEPRLLAEALALEAPEAAAKH